MGWRPRWKPCLTNNLPWPQVSIILWQLFLVKPWQYISLIIATCCSNIPSFLDNLRHVKWKGKSPPSWITTSWNINIIIFVISCRPAQCQWLVIVSSSIVLDIYISSIVSLYSLIICNLPRSHFNISINLIESSSDKSKRKNGAHRFKDDRSNGSADSSRILQR